MKLLWWELSQQQQLPGKPDGRMLRVWGWGGVSYSGWFVPLKEHWLTPRDAAPQRNTADDVASPGADGDAVWRIIVWARRLGNQALTRHNLTPSAAPTTTLTKSTERAAKLELSRLPAQTLKNVKNIKQNTFVFVLSIPAPTVSLSPWLTTGGAEGGYKQIPQLKLIKKYMWGKNKTIATKFHRLPLPFYVSSFFFSF